MITNKDEKYREDWKEEIRKIYEIFDEEVKREQEYQKAIQDRNKGNTPSNEY